MRKISSVKYLSDHCLQILFNDGETRIVNFDKLIDKGGYYFGPLKDIELFKKVSLDEFNYTICWPNGAELSPDILYEMGKDVKEPKLAARRKQVKAPVYAMTKKLSKKTKTI